MGAKSRAKKKLAVCSEKTVKLAPWKVWGLKRLVPLKKKLRIVHEDNRNDAF
jgi:hypothetical protein